MPMESDFGVAVWRDKDGKERKAKTVYVGGKDVYSSLAQLEIDESFSLTASFDIRFQPLLYINCPQTLGTSFYKNAVIWGISRPRSLQLEDQYHNHQSR